MFFFILILLFVNYMYVHTYMANKDDSDSAELTRFRVLGLKQEVSL